MTEQEPHSENLQRDAQQQEQAAANRAALIKRGESLVTEIHAARKSYDAEQKLEQKRNRRPLWGALVVSVIYAFFAGLQWSTLKRQLTDYEIAQAGQINFGDPDLVLNSGFVVIPVENDGQVTVRKMSVIFGWTAQKEYLSHVITDAQPDGDDQLAPIAPTGRNENNNKHLVLHFSDAAIQKLKAGHSTAYVAWSGSFDDGFGHKVRFDYCETGGANGWSVCGYIEQNRMIDAEKRRK